jgi:ferrous iron transport protein A
VYLNFQKSGPADISEPLFAAKHAAPAHSRLLSDIEATVTLDQLPIQASAVVVDVASGGAPDDLDRLLRLTEIGFVPGERVRVVAHGFPGCEPVAVRIGHTTFALRRHEAALVRVMPERGRRDPAKR